MHSWFNTLSLLAVNIITSFYIHFRELHKLRELIRCRHMLQTTNMLMPFFLTSEGFVWQQALWEASWNENCHSLVLPAGEHLAQATFKSCFVLTNSLLLEPLSPVYNAQWLHWLLVTCLSEILKAKLFWASYDSHRYNEIILCLSMFFLMASYSYTVRKPRFGDMHF